MKYLFINSSKYVVEILLKHNILRISLNKIAFHANIKLFNHGQGLSTRRSIRLNIVLIEFKK